MNLRPRLSVSLSTVRDFEKGRRVPIANNLAAMKAALEAGGIAFVDSGASLGNYLRQAEAPLAHSTESAISSRNGVEAEGLAPSGRQMESR